MQVAGEDAGEPNDAGQHVAQHLADQPPLPRRVGRLARRWGSAAVVAALVGGAAWAVAGGLDPPAPLPAPSPAASDLADRAPEAARRDATNPDPTIALGYLLERRSKAVLGGNSSGWLGTVDPRAKSFRSRQAAVFSRLEALPITQWSYQPPAGSAAEDTVTAGRRVMEVRLSYRLSPDGRDTQRRQSLTMVRRDGRWLIASDGDGPTDRDLWDLGPIAVRKGSLTLVVGASSQRADLSRYARETDTAIGRVTAIWGKGWARRVVVVVPRDVEQMATVLGRRKTKGLDKLAAVTTGVVDRSGNGRAADRIVLNPRAFDSFAALGRRVVLTHEVTHVATRPASTVGSPLWLDEGFADYVGFSGSGLSRTAVARTLLAEVRRGRGPTRLPGIEDFDPTKGDVDPAYEGAWLAMDLIARKGGTARVLQFYRTAAGVGSQAAPSSGSSGRSSAAVASAFKRVLKTDQRGFERQWRGYLTDLARQSG